MQAVSPDTMPPEKRGKTRCQVVTKKSLGKKSKVAGERMVATLALQQG